MPSWQADQYLKFANQRTRPCRELAARVAVEYLAAIRDAYPAHRDDRVLFPFRRLFLVAYR